MKRVVVGISGGVDSSVSAILLKQQGYEVIGVTFRFIDDFDDTDAKKVCDSIGITHYTIDYRKEFKKEIIEEFINDYKNGITPNPCIKCNKMVKLNYLYQEMIKLKCDYMATGHYAKIIDSKLYKSLDKNKDQTYFLAEVPKKILEKLLLPLEGVNKSEVREIASKFGLDVANKKDSTDICFITDDFKEYIKKFIKSDNGDIINIETNKKIGTHKGLFFYTLGQRRGIDIGGTSDRLFVVGKNIEKNILYVAEGSNNKFLLSDSCIIDNINFNVDERPSKCTAKFRYRALEYPVELEYLNNNEILVKYDSIKSVTPGQACVFYNGNQCIGGGNIKTVCRDGVKIWYIL